MDNAYNLMSRTIELHLSTCFKAFGHNTINASILYFQSLLQIANGIIFIIDFNWFNTIRKSELITPWCNQDCATRIPHLTTWNITILFFLQISTNGFGLPALVNTIFTSSLIMMFNISFKSGYTNGILTPNGLLVASIRKTYNL
jgi:hypothetical protein